MRAILSLVAILAYVSAGEVLFVRMQRGLRDPHQPVSRAAIFRATLFTDEGQRLRRAAIRFYVLGGTVLVIFLYLLSG